MLHFLSSKNLTYSNISATAVLHNTIRHTDLVYWDKKDNAVKTRTSIYQSTMFAVFFFVVVVLFGGNEVEI